MNNKKGRPKQIKVILNNPSDVNLMGSLIVIEEPAILGTLDPKTNRIKIKRDKKN